MLLTQEDYVPKYQLPHWAKEEYFRKLMAANRPLVAPTPFVPVWDGRRDDNKGIPFPKPRKYYKSKYSRYGYPRLSKQMYPTPRPYVSKRFGGRNVKVSPTPLQLNTMRNVAFTTKHSKPKFNPLFPKDAMKMRPVKKVDYKCECTMGFTGYHCQSWWRTSYRQV